MKLRIQAQHLQPGDIVGSGEKVISVSRGIGTPASKVDIWVEKNGKKRYTIWGKYTMINVERVEVKRYDHKYEAGAYGVCKRCGEEKHANP